MRFIIVSPHSTPHPFSENQKSFGQDMLSASRRRVMSHIVDVKWLHSNISKAKDEITILDCSWPLVGSGIPVERMYSDYKSKRIPHAKFFDIDRVATVPSDVPHMMPRTNKFVQEMKRQGISIDSHIVVYDQHGVYSSPRVWYTFLAMGHKGKVSVLDGGLPAWEKEKYDLFLSDKDVVAPVDLPDEDALEMQNSDTGTLPHHPGEWLVLDARSNGRFEGSAPEPNGRPSGHIPHTKNLPWNDLITNGHTIPDDQTIAKFNSLGLNSNSNLHLAGTCGSALTACVVLWSAVRTGLVSFDNVSLFDHSWKGWFVDDPELNVKGGVKRKSEVLKE